MNFAQGNSEDKLAALLDRVQRGNRRMIGYPATKTVDFGPLYHFMDYMLNNIGDPFSTSGHFRQNTHDFEREVVHWFSDLLHADPEAVWGYVTSGGTEGNMYGVYLARELFPKGMVYFSEDTHYSISKILHMVNARSIMVKSQPNGKMDYGDFAETLSVHRDVPPIIFANIGTTMKGAIDDICEIRRILKDKAISRYYIHADAALSGMVLPFVADPQPFDFAAGIDSISISGHKFPGAPMPCGVVLAKREWVNRVARSVEYIGTNDTTVLGSRNGLTPLFLWYVIDKLGRDGFRDMVRQCMDTADYAIGRFADAGIKAWRNRNSLTVVFPRINERVINDWQIAVQGDEAHLITMPHVTTNTIDNFIEELLS